GVLARLTVQGCNGPIGPACPPRLHPVSNVTKWARRRRVSRPQHHMSPQGYLPGMGRSDRLAPSRDSDGASSRIVFGDKGEKLNRCRGSSNSPLSHATAAALPYSTAPASPVLSPLATAHSTQSTYSERTLKTACWAIASKRATAPGGSPRSSAVV